MRRIALLILVTTALIACKEEVNEVEEAGLSKLRIRNETPYLFDNVYVKIGESENNYGPVKPSETSFYKHFDRASYPFIKVSIQGQEQEFQIQPFEAPPVEMNDRSGIAHPLTCVIHVNEQTNELDLYFIE
jgi:hypothetical protein